MLAGLFLTPAMAVNEKASTALPSNPAAVPLITSNFGGFNIRCSGGNDGSIRIDTVNITGMSGPFAYLWSTGATNYEVTGLSAGFYSVTVTGSGGATQTASVTLTQPNPLVISTTLVDTARCNNAPTGKLKISATGGIAPYSFLWSNGATTDSIFNVSGGNYTVTVTDANACTSVSTIVLPSYPSISLSAVVTPVTCNGGTNGAIDLTVSGGVPGFTYLWTRNGIPAGTTQDISNRIFGSYTVVVTDSKSCTATITRSITQPSPINLSVSTTQPDCFGGSNGIVNLTVSGGAALPIASYSWSSGQTTQDLIGVPAGTYTVTVTDANGCTRFRSFALSQPGPVTPVAVVTNISCFGFIDGEINLSVTGGSGPGTYTYLWDFGSTDEDITGLDLGTYSVVVTDANNCTGTTSATVVSPALLTLSISSDSVSCLNGSDGSLTLAVNGGTPSYSYLWSNGATTQNLPGVPAGVYTVTVTDSNACTAVDSGQVGQPSSALQINLVSRTDVACNGASTGALIVSGSGGIPPYISYLWSNGASGPSVGGLPAGIYTVTLTDNNSCSISSSYTITQPTPVVVNNVVTPASCFGFSNGSITLSVTGGTAPYQYLWNGGATGPNRTNLQAASYTVTVTDNALCTSTSTFTVTQPARLLLSRIITNVACRGAATGGIDLTVTGGTPPYLYLWGWSGGTATTQDISGRNAGIYSVTVTDANACIVSDTDTIVQPPTPLTATISSTPETCNQNNGTASVTPSGGVPPYSYLWSNSSTTSGISGLDVGTYSVSINDSAGCVITLSTTVTAGPFPIVINSTVQNVSCFGGSDGSISVTAGGSFPPYTYLWSTGSTTDTITGRPLGTYTVTITDSTSCSNDTSFFIAQPAAPISLNIVNQRNVDCFGNSTGRIRVAGTGGSPGYTYLWSNGVTTDSIFNLPAGTYTVTVTDSKGCSFDSSITVTQNTQLNVNVVQTRFASCNLDNGCAEAVVTGGVLPYSYLWFNGVTNDTVCGLAPSLSYAVTVTDALNCTTTDSGGVLAVIPHTVFDSTLISPTCHGSTNGSISVDSINNGLPGSNGFNFEWTTVGTPGIILSTNRTLNNIGAGTYVVAVTDSLNCTVRDTFTLTQPPQFVLSFSTKNENCNKADGSAAVSVAGGTPPVISYLWRDSSGVIISTGTFISNRAEGTYSVQITDNNGCTFIQSVQILATPPPLIDPLSIVMQPVNCFGDSTGALDITPVLGAPPYSYVWSSVPPGFSIPSPNTEDIDSIIRGFYELMLIDSAGCMFVDTLEVTGNQEITVDTFVTVPSTCGDFNGCITVTGISGGIAPYSILWDSLSVTTATACSLAAGSYTVTISDSLNCSNTFQGVLSNIDGPVPVMDSIKNNGCFGDSLGGIYVSVTGIAPFSYSWTNSQGAVISTEQYLDSVPAGGYCLTVVDGNQCSNTLCDSVLQPDQLILNGAVTNASCNNANGIIAVIATGGVPLPSNNYVYFWPDANINASVRTNMSSGAFICEVLDQNNCRTIDTFIVDQTGIPAVVTLSVVTDSVDCNGEGDGNLNFVLTGGVPPYAYTWPPGSLIDSITVDSVFIADLAAGTYYIPVADGVGCNTLVGPFIVSEPAAIQPQFGTNPATCGNSDGSAWVTAVTGGTAPYSYQWRQSGDTVVISSDDTLFTVAAGAYVLTVTDFYGCTLDQSVIVTNFNGPQLDSIDIATITCFGRADGAVTISVSSNALPLTYEWSWVGANPPPGLDTITGPSASGLITGDYEIIVRDSNNCPLFVSVPLLQPDLLSVTLNAQQPNPPYNVSCFGYSDGSVQTTTTGGTSPYSFVWSTGDTLPFVSNLTAGIYSLLVTDVNGCSRTEVITLIEPGDILPDPAPGYPGCAGSDTSFCGQDLVVNLNACDPAAGIGVWSVISTSGDSVVFQNQNSNNTGVTGLGTGANILQWTVQVNYSQVVCMDSDRVSIFTSDTVIAIGGVDQRICDGEIRLNATQPAFGAYHWETFPVSDIITFQNSSDPLTDVYGLQYGPNTFVWIVENGSCNDTDTVVVFRNNEFDCLSPIDMPTAFSPNFDGKNDYFVIKGIEDYADNELIIYNRWGQVVYNKSSYRNEWYGANENGKPVPDGTYFVILKIPLIDKVYKTYIDLRR